MANDITLELNNEAATLAAGGRFSTLVQPGLVVYLHGDLGAGKTTFVRGFLRGLGHQGKVKSPTYTLVEPYVVSSYNIYHFDLYRFIDEEEWESVGFRDYFNPSSICFVEWPEKAENLLPTPDIDIYLTPNNEGRILQFSAHSDLGRQVLQSNLHESV